jgi:hypothetical protein
MNVRSMLAAACLVMLGSLQMVADLAQWPQVKGVAAALQVAPAMKVFTAHQGYETHAARFHLSWTDRTGAPQILALDPRTYARVGGPYNRRNVYGAALAYGPLLRADPKLRAMQASVMQHAFCRPGTMRAEIGLPYEANSLTMHVTPTRATARHDLELSWEIRCHE